MRQMNAVHSRIGLTFTALVEIAVSTITSLSVCALVGFKVTMVPWYYIFITSIFTMALIHSQGVASTDDRFRGRGKHV